MDAMVVVFIVFMSFVSIMCLFAMLIVTRDLIWSGREKRGQEAATPVPQPAPETPVPVKEVEPEPAPEPEPEPVKEPEPVALQDAQEETAITFAPGSRKTLDEAYAELPRKFRDFYDEVAKHAEKAPGVTRHIKNDNYEEWKINQSRLVRLKIRRGLVTAEFILQNSEMKEHIVESKIDVKQSMTVVKLEDRTAVQFVNESIDLIVKVLEEEREKKKAERAQARRERAREKRRMEAENKE